MPVIDTVFVRPRRGLILAGIPRQGAAISRELADDWIAAQLVERVEPETPVTPKKPVARRSPKGSGATRPRKRRSNSR
jgi:hypothetical protein